MMNYKEIERLKSMLIRLSGQGCRVKNTAYGIDGKLVGVGFRPLWTNQADSRIDKVELNILDAYGRIIPFNLHYVVGYEITPLDGKRADKTNNISVNIHVFSPNRAGNNEPYDKFTFELSKEQ